MISYDDGDPIIQRPRDRTRFYTNSTRYPLKVKEGKIGRSISRWQSSFVEEIKLIPFPGDMILITIRWIAGYLSISSAVNFYFFIARMYTHQSLSLGYGDYEALCQ